MTQGPVRSIGRARAVLDAVLPEQRVQEEGTPFVRGEGMYRMKRTAAPLIDA